MTHRKVELHHQLFIPLFGILPLDRQPETVVLDRRRYAPANKLRPLVRGSEDDIDVCAEGAGDVIFFLLLDAVLVFGFVGVEAASVADWEEERPANVREGREEEARVCFFRLGVRGRGWGDVLVDFEVPIRGFRRAAAQGEEVGHGSV